MRGRAVASLHSGDRAGTRYYNVMAGGDGSGRIRDGFTDQVTAFALNPHVEIGGLELFGVLETTSGNRAGAEDDGRLAHCSAEAVYRFADGGLFAGVRYGTVDADLGHSGHGEPANRTGGNTVNRWQWSAGWFMTGNVLVRGGYATQSYDGLMIKGTVSF